MAGARWYWPGQYQALAALRVSETRMGSHGFFEVHQLIRLESASLAPGYCGRVIPVGRARYGLGLRRLRPACRPFGCGRAWRR
jgi:hypothetical protein